MAGILSKKWHNKRSGWRFFPEEAIDRLSEIIQRPYDLDSVLGRASQARPDMLECGKTLAAHLGGVFMLAPNKTREQSLKSIAYKEGNLSPEQLADCSYSLLDPVRGCIEVDGIEGLTHARTKLRSILDYKQSTILNVSDRYSRPPRIGLRGIFVSVKMPNGVIGEIQVHTKDYWAGLNQIRPLYEEYRTMWYQGYLAGAEQVKRAQLEEAGDPVPRTLTREWSEADHSRLEELSKARIRGLRDLAIRTGVDHLCLKDQNYEGDCSFPLRPVFHLQSGQSGYLIPVYRQSDLVKSDFTHRRLRYSL